MAKKDSCSKSLNFSRTIDFIIICILFFTSFVYFSVGYRYFNLGTYHYDEAISAYGAVRVLDGDMPYRDFWTLYGPGQFYLLAIIFKIFGISIKVKRLFALVILSLTVCSIYFLIKRLCSRTFGALAFLISLAGLKSYMVYNRPGQLSILCFIFSCFTLLNYINSRRTKWLIITGSLAGLVGLFRQDFGLYIFVSLFLVVLLGQLNRSQEEKWQSQLGLILKKEVYLFVGTILVLLPVCIYFIANQGIRELIIDTIIFPVTVYPKVRRLPFPGLKGNTLIFYLPIFVFLLTSIKLLFYNWKTKIKSPTIWLRLFLLFFGLGLLNYTNVRTCQSHLLPTIIPAVILFILLLNDFLKKFSDRNRYCYRYLICNVLFLISFVLLFYSIKPSFMKLRPFLEKEGSFVELDIARAQGFYDDTEIAESQISAIKYIRDRTKSDEKIFVGNARHDRVVNSDVMFYFLSGRGSVTKYHELHPGLTTTLKVQEHIINEIKRSDTKYIVLWDDLRTCCEPNESCASTGARDLDNFIKGNYKIVQEFSPYYKILTKK